MDAGRAQIERQTGRRQLYRQRLDVKQAAEVLNISSEGVRKRIKRGSLEAEKGPDGKVYVWLDTDWTGSDAGRTGLDEGSDAQQTADKDAEAIEILRDQVEFLRAQLEVWQEEARRKDHLLAALTERIPELEPASEAPESPETAAAGTEGVEAPLATEERQRGFWRRFFGI